MRVFVLYVLFLVIALQILSFALRPQILIVKGGDSGKTDVVRHLTYNPWATEDFARLQEQTLTSRMEKQSYDLRDSLTF